MDNYNACVIGVGFCEPFATIRTAVSGHSRKRVSAGSRIRSRRMLASLALAILRVMDSRKARPLLGR